MARVMFFFDGFNVYHSLREFHFDNTAGKNIRNYEKYKWLDLYQLAKMFVKKEDVIDEVYYFTAYATWLPDPMARHKIYVKALQNAGVRIVLGKFKSKDKRCKICKRKYKTNEEKQTDVNIALYLFREAVLDRYDKAFLVTADSDLVPAVELAKKTFPGKEIILLTPIGRNSIELKNTCDFRMKIKEKHLKASQFPNLIDLGNGKKLEKPTEWS